jgi:amidase
MRRLSSNKIIYMFSKKNKPVCSVKDGERIVVETMDCFSGKAKSSKDLFEDIAMGNVNPATGPIEVEGLVGGQTLCVEIERIKCGKTGVAMCSPNVGFLSRDVRRSRTKIIEIRGGKAKFSEDLEIDLNPHIGVIGVSPAKGEFPVFYPGPFGGNMDTVEVREGSKVYLPTFVDGGMVAMGDVHAAMGDGEVCGTGLEVAAELTVRLSTCEELELKRPMIETSTEWISFAAAKTLGGAAKLATSDLVRFIADRRGVDFEEAYMLASLSANLKISQVVDPLMAARMSISKRYL